MKKQRTIKQFVAAYGRPHRAGAYCIRAYCLRRPVRVIGSMFYRGRYRTASGLRSPNQTGYLPGPRATKCFDTTTNNQQFAPNLVSSLLNGPQIRTGVYLCWIRAAYNSL